VPRANVPPAKVSPAGVPGVVPGRRQTIYHGKKLGVILVEQGKLTLAQVDEAVQRARLSGMQLGKYLLREGYISPQELCRALSLQSGLPMTSLSTASIPPQVKAPFSRELMIRYDFVPFDENRELVCVAAGSLLPSSVLQELHQVAGKKVDVYLAPEEEVLRVLDTLRSREPRQEAEAKRRPVMLPAQYQFCNRLGRITDEATYPGRTVEVQEDSLIVEGPAPRALLPDEVRRRGLCLRVEVAWGASHIHLLCDPRSIEIRQRLQSHELPWLMSLRILEVLPDDLKVFQRLCTEVSGGPPRGATLGPIGHGRM
jgi:hypothetical protein